MQRFHLWILAMVVMACGSGSSPDVDEDTGGGDTKIARLDTGSDTGSGPDTGRVIEDDTWRIGPGPEPCDDVTVDCYSECWGCATSDPELCGHFHRDCQENPSCVGYEHCRLDNCVPGDLSGDDIAACEALCRESWPDGLELHEALYRCVFCDACWFSCRDEAGSFCDVPCDGTPCYSECWGCAMNNECRGEVRACEANEDCQGLENCLMENCYLPTFDPDFWLQCKNQCKAEWPDGVALFEAYYDCIYCVGCPFSCSMDAADRCSCDSQEGRCLGGHSCDSNGNWVKDPACPLEY